MSVNQLQGARQRRRECRLHWQLTTILTDLCLLKQESNDPDGFEFLDGQIALTAGERLLMN